MKIIVLIMCASFLFMAYEYYNAPLMDDEE